MKIAYIAHRIGGNIEENLADLRRIIRHINMTMPDVVPFCPYYADVVSLDDNIPEERERGIRNDTELMQQGFIDEVWLTGPSISKGMENEATMSAILGIQVIDYIGKL